MSTDIKPIEEVIAGLQDKIKPEFDKIIVRKLKEDDDVASKVIVLPDQAKNKYSLNKGEVIAVGPGMLQDDGLHRTMDIHAGEILLFSKHCGTELKLDGIECYVITEHDVLAKVKKDDIR